MDTEMETGTYLRSAAPRRHHDGYWAGDFDGTTPMPWEQLRRVMELGRPAGVGGAW